MSSMISAPQTRLPIHTLHLLSSENKTAVKRTNYWRKLIINRKTGETLQVAESLALAHSEHNQYENDTNSDSSV